MENPFDEQFDGYVLGEDLDMSARMLRRGRLIHNPRARCRHEGDVQTDAVSLAFRRGCMYALYRGRHRRPTAAGWLA